eukprot:Nk52_evm7s155 gene=Nk52_evmTU7s155
MVKFNLFGGKEQNEEISPNSSFDLRHLQRRTSSHKNGTLTGFIKSSDDHNRGLALLNPYLSEKDLSEEIEESHKFQSKNFIQQLIISDHPSDLRLIILQRLPQKWGLRVRRVPHKPMAEWYDPVNLLSVAAGALVTLVIGERTDTRPLYGVMDTVERLKGEVAELRRELAMGRDGEGGGIEPSGGEDNYYYYYYDQGGAGISLSPNASSSSIAADPRATTRHLLKEIEKNSSGVAYSVNDSARDVRRRRGEGKRRSVSESQSANQSSDNLRVSQGLVQSSSSQNISGIGMELGQSTSASAPSDVLGSNSISERSSTNTSVMNGFSVGAGNTKSNESGGIGLGYISSSMRVEASVVESGLLLSSSPSVSRNQNGGYGRKSASLYSGAVPGIGGSSDKQVATSGRAGGGRDGFVVRNAGYGRGQHKVLLEWYDYVNEKPEGYFLRHKFTFDFIADTGDGWNSTFTIAQILAQPELRVHPQDVRECGPPHEYIYLPRGRVLLLGGDLVYPHPSIEEYQSRFVEPFRHALWSEKKRRTAFEFASDRANREEYRTCPHMFAIPGNHDWMDGLVAFRRILCDGHRLGGWVLPQRRSYFANRFPDGWWLFGIDDQLTYDIDDSQFKYFKRVCAGFTGGEAVVVCMHRPFWILDGKPPLVMSMLFEEIIGTDRLKLVLAGDLHNYSRYEYVGFGTKARKSSSTGNVDPHCGYHLIVAGGGGAFLHPTHVLANNITIEGTKKIRYDNFSDYKLGKVYPRKRTSKLLNYRNVFFLYENLSFGIAAGVINVILVGFLSADLWWDVPCKISSSQVGGAAITSSQDRVGFRQCLTDTSTHLMGLNSPLFTNPDPWSVENETGAFLLEIGSLLMHNYIFPLILGLVAGICSPLWCFASEFLVAPMCFCVVLGALSSPLFCGMFCILWFALGIFTDIQSNSRLWMAIVGFIHACAHAFFAILSHGAYSLHVRDYLLETLFHVNIRNPGVEEIPASNWLRLFLLFEPAILKLWIFLTGLLSGPTVFGAYLIISTTIFGRHDYDAFAAMRLDGYKNIVRLRIDSKKHTLEVFAIGIDRVCRKWPLIRDAGRQDNTTMDSQNPLWYSPRENTNCHLIEQITIPKNSKEGDNWKGYDFQKEGGL